MFKNACRTCSTIIFPLLTNNITAFWRCRCRSRRRFLNSLFPILSHHYKAKGKKNRSYPCAIGPRPRLFCFVFPHRVAPKNKKKRVSRHHWSPTRPCFVSTFLFYFICGFFCFVFRMLDFSLFFCQCHHVTEKRNIGPRPKQVDRSSTGFPFFVFYQPLRGLEQSSSTYSSSISPQLMYPRCHHVAQSKGPLRITAVSDLDYSYAFIHYAISWHNTKKATTQNNSIGPRPNHSSTLYGLQKNTLSFLGPVSRKSRKLLFEIANRLFQKADLLTCFQGNKKKNSCEV